MDLCFASSFTPLTRPAVRAHVSSRVPLVTTTTTMKLRGFGSPRRWEKNFGGSGGAGGGAGGGDGNTGGGGVGGGGGGGGGSSGASSSSDGPTNPFAQLWAAYNGALESKPILTKAMTSLVGFSIGDLLAQKFLGEQGAAIDLWRIARMAAFGFLIHGPTGHYFYSALDRVIVGKTPVKVVSKVFVDQVLWAPIFTVLFFSFLGAAERKSPQEIVDKVKADTWAGVTASWKFWPMAHAVNFAFIPTQQRLLYINTLQVGYNMILSVLGNRGVPEKLEEATS